VLTQHVHIRIAAPDEVSLAFEIDDDATRLFLEHGLALDLAHDHPFVVDEHRRWREAAADGRMWLATEGEAVLGFVTTMHVDGAPYIDQLAVRYAAMRRGVGRALLDRALAWALPATEVWLTTYAHLAWNGPYYARHGFEVVPEAELGREMKAILAAQRGVLIDPEQRVAMRRA
jgi:GNAT superfamily N-acetyltransferase